MKKKCKVVMLPTDGKSKLYKAPWDEPPFIGYFRNPQETIKGDTIAQHLYLISDEDIKEGDWLVSIKYGNLRQCTGVQENEYLCVGNNNGVLKSAVKKVIASTNPELTIKTTREEKIVKPGVYEKSLPTFSEDFIKAYVKANGQIDEVNVEYEESSDWSRSKEGVIVGIKAHYIPKLTDNNEVIISMVEEKMYSREEVELIVAKAMQWNGRITTEAIDKWIQKNL